MLLLRSIAKRCLQPRPGGQFRTLPRVLFSTPHHEQAASVSTPNQNWLAGLEQLRKLDLNAVDAKTMTAKLQELAKVVPQDHSAAKLPSDLHTVLNNYFEDNYEKITPAEAVELAKYCAKLPGTEDCFWVWYNLERIVKTDIFAFTRTQIDDLATAFAEKLEGSETLWYDIYRAYCKHCVTMKWMFSRQKPFKVEDYFIARGGSHSSHSHAHHAEDKHTNEHHDHKDAKGATDSKHSEDHHSGHA
jgi:hypothetical protein